MDEQDKETMTKKENLNDRCTPPNAGIGDVVLDPSGLPIDSMVVSDATKMDTGSYPPSGYSFVVSLNPITGEYTAMSEEEFTQRNKPIDVTVTVDRTDPIITASQKPVEGDEDPSSLNHTGNTQTALLDDPQGSEEHIVDEVMFVETEAPPVEKVALDPQIKAMLMQANPDLKEEDLEDLQEDELALFADLAKITESMNDIAQDLQKSSEMGGPSSIVGFIREFMRITKTGVGELSAETIKTHAEILRESGSTDKPTGIHRLRLTSILQETVDMSHGEVDMISRVLLPRYQRWKAIQDKPVNVKRREKIAAKRLAKKQKKMKHYDPITGLPRS